MDVARQNSKEAHQPVGEGISAVLNRLLDDIDRTDREKRLQMFRKQIKAHQYMDGNFFGYVDQNLNWREREKGSDETWYSDNQVYPYIRTALMEMSRSGASIIIVAPEGASDEQQQAAKFAQHRYNTNRARTTDSLLKQTENCYAILNGITFRYTFTHFGGPGASAERMPVVNPKTSQAGGTKVCSNCHHPALETPDIEEIGEQQGGDKCLKCGSEMFTEVDLGEESGSDIDYENVPTGRNTWIVPNPIGIVVAMNASRIKETPYLLWKQMILRSVLEAKYEGITFPSTGTPSLELRYIANQQVAVPEAGSKAGDSRGMGGDDSSGSADFGTPGSGRELEMIEFHQGWLDYPLYCNLTFPEDMPLGRGKVLKAGQKMGTAFRKGCFVARADRLIVTLWDEDKNRKWTSSPYGLRPGSMYGSGSHTAMSDQEIINDLMTIKMANAWSNGVPKEFVDPEFITELSADPQIPTRLSSPMGQTGNIIGRAYAVSPALDLGASFYEIEDKTKSSMQNKIGALSGTGAGGLQDTQKWGNTATAISIKRDLAVGRFGPDLELMADLLDREQAIQFLQNEQEFYTDEQWEKEKGTYGEAALQAFRKADITSDFLITVAPGSHLPTTEAQSQGQLGAFAEMVPVLSQLQNPEYIAYAEEVFGIPEHLGGWATDRAYAGRVVQRFEALAELAISQGGDLPSNDLTDPLVAKAAQAINEFAQMPVDYFLDNHQALIDAYRDWRTTDSGRDAPNALLAAVALRTQMHVAGIAKQGQIATGVQMATAAPAEEKAAAAQSQAEEQARSDAEQTQMVDGLHKGLELDEKQTQRDHEAEMADKKMAADEQRSQAQLEAKNPPPPAESDFEENSVDGTPTAVIDSVKFADLPPSGQQILAAKAGIDIPVSDFEEEDESDEGPKAATGPVTPSQE